MAQGLILLHSSLVAASRDFLAQWGDAGEVVTDQAAAAALTPAFAGYPSVVYEDAHGARQVFFNPSDMEAVEAWKAGIDIPADTSTISKLDFLNRFTDDVEFPALKAAEATNLDVAGFWEKFRAAEYISLTDPRTITMVQKLEDGGLLAVGRAAEILTP